MKSETKGLNTRTTECRYGTMTYLANDPIIGKSLREYGEWAQEEISFLLSLIDAGDTVVDAGAFIGTHTLPFAKQVGPGGTVYSFEPHPLSYKLLSANISQNGFEWVVNENYGLSESHSSLIVNAQDPSWEQNPGNFSLLPPYKESPKEQGQLFEIEMRGIDELGLDSCKLIKIDAEGMEEQIVRGAIQTIREHRPYVFAECLAIEQGWPLVQKLVREGYSVYLHVSSGFNPHNFKGNLRNFLPYGREAGLIFHPSPEKNFGDYLTSTLIPIETLDDLVLGMLLKPQYKPEILEKTRTAKIVGNHFWANEPELAYLDRSLETLRSTYLESEGQSRDLIQRVNELSKSLREEARKRSELQGLVQKLENTVAKSRVISRNLEEALRSANSQLTSIQKSRSWRLTRPLRAAMAIVRMQGISDGAAHVWAEVPASLRYSIDSLAAQGGRISGWGWVFDSSHNIAGISLVARTTEGIVEIPCQYALQRNDVAEKFPAFSSSRSSGFFLLSDIGKSKLRGAALKVAIKGQDPIRIDVTHLIEKRRVGIRSRASDLLRMARQADMLLLSRKISTAVGHILRGEFSQFNRKASSLVGAFIAPQDDTDPFIDRAVAELYPPDLLLFDHDLGGGANMYREELLGLRLIQSEIVWLVTYDVPTLSYRVQIRVPDLEDINFRLMDLEGLIDVLEDRSLNEVFINNLYTYENILDVPGIVTRLKENTGADLTIAIHDYLMICPSFKLLNYEGMYCGVPADLSVCANCLANHTGEWTHLISEREILNWRWHWKSLIDLADSVLCFSESSWQILTRAFDDLDSQKVDFEPHNVGHLSRQTMPLKPSGRLHIGVVGQITFSKGAQIINEICEVIQNQQLPIRITVIGTMIDPPQMPFINITGPYERYELPSKLIESGANVFLFPSIWPETFSYVVEELVTLGVPVAVFDIGAPPERVSSYEKGIVISKINAQSVIDNLMAWFREENSELAHGNYSPSGEKSSSHVHTNHIKAVIQPTASHEQASRVRSENSGGIHVFTSAAANYIPKVKILFESIKEYHPEFTLHLALPDERPSWLTPDRLQCESIIQVSDLPIPAIRAWIFQHSLVELSTAMKPHILKHLFSEEDCEAVVYFDPDIVLFSRLDDLLINFESSSILLTPHITHPQPDIESVLDNEVNSVLKHGVYNLGFLAVKNDTVGLQFTDWWSERLAEFCMDRIDHGLFVDQKWVDMVPGMFPGVHIERDPRFNVATWNLTTRYLDGSFDEGFKVEERPLGFYHFTGFDSGDHEVMRTKHARENYASSELVEWYKKSIEPQSREEVPWAYGVFGNGEQIRWAHRAVYRIREELHDRYPDPFLALDSEDSYFRWFAENAVTQYPDILNEEKARASRFSKDVRNILIDSNTHPAASSRTHLIREPRRLSRRVINVFREEGLRGILSRLIRL